MPYKFLFDMGCSWVPLLFRRGLNNFFSGEAMSKFALIMLGICFIFALIVILLIVVDEYLYRRND